jgi:hypothetical protein
VLDVLTCDLVVKGQADDYSTVPAGLSLRDR